jgi:hypothetical protein
LRVEAKDIIRKQKLSVEKVTEAAQKALQENLSSASPETLKGYIAQLENLLVYQRDEPLLVTLVKALLVYFGLLNESVSSHALALQTLADTLLKLPADTLSELLSKLPADTLSELLAKVRSCDALNGTLQMELSKQILLTLIPKIVAPGLARKETQGRRLGEKEAKTYATTEYILCSLREEADTAPKDSTTPVSDLLCDQMEKDVERNSERAFRVIDSQGKERYASVAGNPLIFEDARDAVLGLAQQDKNLAKLLLQGFCQSVPNCLTQLFVEKLFEIVIQVGLFAEPNYDSATITQKDRDTFEIRIDWNFRIKDTKSGGQEAFSVPLSTAFEVVKSADGSLSCTQPHLIEDIPVS